MIAVVHVTEARRGAGACAIDVGGATTVYTVTIERIAGVHTVSIAESGAERTGALRKFLPELAELAIANGRGRYRYDLRHDADGDVRAYPLPLRSAA